GTALVLITIWVETAWEYDWLARANGIVWILAALGVVVVPLSSLLPKKEAKPAVATPEGASPTDSPTQSTASPRLCAASLHRLQDAVDRFHGAVGGLTTPPRDRRTGRRHHRQ